MGSEWRNEGKCANYCLDIVTISDSKEKVIRKSETKVEKNKSEVF